MNKCYALVWNVSQGCWNVVSEGSRRRGKPAGAKAAIALIGCCFLCHCRKQAGTREQNRKARAHRK